MREHELKESKANQAMAALALVSNKLYPVRTKDISVLKEDIATIVEWLEVMEDMAVVVLSAVAVGDGSLVGESLGAVALLGLVVF